MRHQRRRRGQRDQQRDQGRRQLELRRRPGADWLQQQHLQGQRHLGAQCRDQHVPAGIPPASRLFRPAQQGADGLGRADQHRPQTIVYKIKQEAVWSDGTPVSSDDGKTVTVVFSEPFTDWKSLFYGLLPAEYMAKVPGGWNTGLDKSPEKIPVNGPYAVSAWEQGQSLTLARNDKYFGPKAHLDSIVFRFLPESTTQPAALQNNEVDLIYPQPQLDLVAQVKALPDVTSELNIGLSFEHLDFNFKNEHLADPNVRRAIATGLNISEPVDRTSSSSPLRQSCWRTPATPRAPTASTPWAARS